jgi:monovalent cation:H+ antiporter, CPA1 family
MSFSEAMQTPLAEFVLLLLVAAAVAVLVKRLPLPYVTALALVGAAIGVGPHPPTPTLTRSLIFFAILPGLLFEAGFNLSWGHLRRDLSAVGLLATLGVFLTMAVVAALSRLFLGLPLPVAILFGAMVAPTDPVAVVALFRRLGVSPRLTTILEAESLFNDGTGIVVFGIALAAVSSGTLSWPSAVLDFLRLTVGGLALGAILGVLLSWLTARLDDPQIEITFTAIAAYGGYLLAETLHVSGILAVVAAAVVLGSYGRTHGMSRKTSAAVDAFWAYVAFLLNSAVFLLIGLSVPLADVLARWPVIVGAGAVVLAARALAVYGIFGSIRLIKVRLDMRSQHVLVWGGLRGAVAVALLLSIPGSVRAQIGDVPALVYGVVLLTLVVQGITIGPLAARLGLRRSHQTHDSAAQDPD